MVSWIDGGVCAAQGFRAAGLHVGVKTHNVNKKDVALIVSDADCAAAAVFTTNVVKAAPIHVTKAHLADGRARAVNVSGHAVNSYYLVTDGVDAGDRIVTNPGRHLKNNARVDQDD